MQCFGLVFTFLLSTFSIVLFLNFFVPSDFTLFQRSRELLHVSSFSNLDNSKNSNTSHQELPTSTEDLEDWIPQIFFLISFMSKTTEFNLQTACSIESALRKNPRSKVYVFYDDTPKPKSFGPRSEDNLNTSPKTPIPLTSPIVELDEETENDTVIKHPFWTKNMELWFLKPPPREFDPRHFSVHLLWLRLVSKYRGRLFAYRLNYTEVFGGTPLLSWYLQEFHRMKYNHLSDALRLGTLYHFGGAYFDTDWISLRSIEKLRNVVGIEAPTFPKEDTEKGMVNGAVMIFERKHAFLQKCVDWIYTAWNYSKNPRDDWTIIGPRFLDYTWKWMKARNQTGDMQVLPPHSFYPVFYTNTNVFESKLNSENAKLTLWYMNYTDCYGVHLWNKMYPFVKPTPGTLVHEIMRQSCPMTLKDYLLSNKENV